VEGVAALAADVETEADPGLGGRIRRQYERVAHAVSWTPPTSTEIGVVAKSALAAGLAWWLAGLLTDVTYPVLAPLTAIVVVQVSVRSSVRSAIQRSAAVVLGVLLALAIGDALGLNGFTVAILVAVSLGVAELVLRLPPAAARQVPISALIVLTAVASAQQSSAWERALDTVVGATVGVAVSLVLPASRLVDARQTLDRLASSLGDVLETMGSGLQQTWSTQQTAEWRRRARTTRDRLVRQAAEAVGNGRESARWNVRDRRNIDVLGSYEEVLPRLERTAIGVSVISRGLDDHARLGGTSHRAMPAMGALLIAMAGAVRAVVHDLLGDPSDATVADALAEVRSRRLSCIRAASRRAREALQHDDPTATLEGEWLNYAALLVQVDRIISDLSAPLPT
jgi:Fusaric acid resistance protein-like